jgi:hypothetical protein
VSANWTKRKPPALSTHTPCSEALVSRIFRAGIEPLASKRANSGTCLQVLKLENAALKDNLLHVTGRDEKWLSDDIQDARLQGALPQPGRSTPCMLHAAAREAHVTSRCVRRFRCDVQRRRIGARSARDESLCAAVPVRCAEAQNRLREIEMEEAIMRLENQAFGECGPLWCMVSIPCRKEYPWDTMPHGIPCRMGYQVAREKGA